MKRITLLFITIIALLSNTANSQNQKAVKILESMQERYEQSIKDIDDYILEKGDHTTFNKKAYTEDGRPYFKTKTKGEYTNDRESAPAANKNLYSQLTRAKEKANYKGTDEVDGNEVHVIYIDQMEIEGLNPDKETDNTMEDIFLYIDSDKLVARKMEYTMKSEIKSGEVREISLDITNRDFRNVNGMQIPYKTTTVAKGLTLTDEERKKAKKGLKDFEEKMEEMPQSQREMIEEMAGDEIEKYRKMIEKDQYEKVSQVKNIEVNTGMKMEDF
ncbi:MAG: hypothetical protein K9G70_10645 [Prolixibacteraceae bacterium]|nr:hypothetical protein [Prolixibacteraceae bacterium]